MGITAWHAMGTNGSALSVVEAAAPGRPLQLYNARTLRIPAVAGHVGVSHTWSRKDGRADRGKD